jgi:hypothetical protein
MSGFARFAFCAFASVVREASISKGRKYFLNGNPWKFIRALPVVRTTNHQQKL